MRVRKKGKGEESAVRWGFVLCDREWWVRETGLCIGMCDGDHFLWRSSTLCHVPTIIHSSSEILWFLKCFLQITTEEDPNPTDCNPSLIYCLVSVLFPHCLLVFTPQAPFPEKVSMGVVVPDILQNLL